MELDEAKLGAIPHGAVGGFEVAVPARLADAPGHDLVRNLKHRRDLDALRLPGMLGLDREIALDTRFGNESDAVRNVEFLPVRVRIAGQRRDRSSNGCRASCVFETLS